MRTSALRALSTGAHKYSEVRALTLPAQFHDLWLRVDFCDSNPIRPIAACFQTDDALPNEAKRREESRRGTQECARHKFAERSQLGGRVAPNYQTKWQHFGAGSNIRFSINFTERSQFEELHIPYEQSKVRDWRPQDAVPVSY